MFEDPWRLTNDGARRSLERKEVPVVRERQRALFSGLDCLPGQRDLFETDGERVDASAERATTVGLGDHGRA
jgi:hypothetical protein